MKKVFVDTSGWLAVLISSDSLRQIAVDIYREILSSGRDMVTHEAILLEIGNALSAVKTRNTALKLKAIIAKSSRIELIALMPSHTRSGLEAIFRTTRQRLGNCRLH